MSPSADKKTWTYHLQAGLKWDDGKPITSADFKYAFERLFATDVINGGPTFYYLCLLDKCSADGTPTYRRSQPPNGLVLLAEGVVDLDQHLP